MKGRVAMFAGAEMPLSIREFPVPPPPPGGLVVRVRQANICGSDLHFWRGHGPFGAERPVVLGHEAVATVAALGAGTTTDSLGRPLSEGDRVIYSYFRPCGRCWDCITGKSGCQNRNSQWVGAGGDVHPHFRGAFADYFYMEPGHWVYRVPDDLPDEFVSPVNCALSEVLYALHQGGITNGDTVLIQGAGGLGLYACAMARDSGAGHVISVDRLEHRLELARQFGADVTLNAAVTDEAERAEKVMELTGGIGVDLALEVTGSPAVIPEGLRLLRPGGTYLWVGTVGTGLSVELDPTQVVRQHKTIKGIIAYEQWAMPRALAFLQRNRDRFPFERIISHHFPFEEVDEALRVASRGDCIRATLQL